MNLSAFEPDGNFGLHLVSEVNAAVAFVQRHRDAFDFESDDITELLHSFKIATHSVFSFMDAHVWHYRSAIARAVDNPVLQLSPRDRRWLLNSPDHARFWKSLKLVVKYTPTLLGVPSSFGSATQDFALLRSFVRCRESITHMQGPRDLFPFELLKLFRPGAQWFLMMHSELLAGQYEKLSGQQPFNGASGRPDLVSHAELKLAASLTDELLKSRYMGGASTQVDQYFSDILEDGARSLELAASVIEKSGPSDSQWAHRGLLASLFCAIEGILRCCDECLCALGRRPDARIDHLLDLSAEGFRAVLCTVASRFSEEFGREVVLEETSSGLGSLIVAQKARNRLLHPRPSARLDLSSSEVQHLPAALSWIHESLIPAIGVVPTRPAWTTLAESDWSLSR